MFRARVVNPRWMAAMRRHGYKGAFEMAATVDYLFGYDATAGVVDDWMYEKLGRVRLRPGEPGLHEEVQPLGAARHHRAAAGGRRPGLWAEPDAETLERLRDVYLTAKATWRTRK